MSRVAIIILNYNTWEYTNRCLESIFNQDNNEYTIFIVDNLSKNDSVNKICGFLDEMKKHYLKIKEDEKYDNFSNIVLIEAKENNGYAAGNNIALRKAIDSRMFEYYWVINNDIEVERNTLSLMVECLENDSYKRPVGNYVYYYDDKEKLQMAGGLEISRKNFKPFFSNNKKKIDYLGGVSYLIDNSFISKYGLMFEGYFLNSEDLEYFYNYKLDFLKVNKNESAFNVVGNIFHKESATQGKVSPMSNYYYSRNLLYSCNKFNPNIMKNLYMFFIIRIIKWFIIDRKMALAIIMAIKDYNKSIIGKVEYFNEK